MLAVTSKHKSDRTVMEPEAARVAEFWVGACCVRPGAHLLILPDQRAVPLTAKEVAMLNYLVCSRPNPVPRSALLRDVWGYNEQAQSHTIETHIYRLRRKIEPDPRRPRTLVTESGGYRLVDVGGQ